MLVVLIGGAEGTGEETAAAAVGDLLGAEFSFDRGDSCTQMLLLLLLLGVMGGEKILGVVHAGLVIWDDVV